MGRGTNKNKKLSNLTAEYLMVHTEFEELFNAYRCDLRLFPDIKQRIMCLENTMTDIFDRMTCITKNASITTNLLCNAKNL